MSHRTLPSFRFDQGTCIAQAQPPLAPVVTLTSPASSVMTDLTRTKAATIGQDATLAEARQVMIHQGVRLLFVVENMPCIEGLITSTDLDGDRPMQVQSQRNCRYDELLVSDVMTGLTHIDAIDYDDLGHADVGSVVATLKQLGRRHMLVVQKASATAGPRVRGVISQTQIERQLGRSIGATEIASTFAEIQQALRA